MKDLYNILGVNKTANLSEIKKAYRKLSKKFHPDVNFGDKYFEEKFKEVLSAYEILSNEQKRIEYDDLLKKNIFKRSDPQYKPDAEDDLRQREQKIRDEERQKKEREQFNQKQNKNSWIIALFVIAFTIGGILLLNTPKNSHPDVISNPKIEIKELIEGPNPIKKESKNNTGQSWLNGIWIGKAYQFDINESWSILLNCDNNKNIYKIEYPSLQCGGKWTIISQSENRIEFREKLNYGTNICTDNGKIILENINDNLYFYYYFPNDNTLNAKCILHQKR